jgi:chromate transporter
MGERQAGRSGTAGEVLAAFLRLGCTSFGGPVAHLGYFHAEFVERRGWCDEESYAQIVALAQALPGPASSQVGFALGVQRAGGWGGAAAWLGFTMPSALLLLAFAFGHRLLAGPVGVGVVHGLQLVAVAVVAQAVLTMRRSLAPDPPRLLVAGLAALLVYFNLGTLLAIAAGAVAGLLLPPGAPPGAPINSRATGMRLPHAASLWAAALFTALLFGMPLASAVGRAHGARHPLAAQAAEVAEAFYRTGALVFGGGHVVLPLLERAVVARGWVSAPDFLAGYGAAQAVPGPLFTFAAYLGAMVQPQMSPVLIASVALVSIFAPGLLLMIAVLPYWERARERAAVYRALRGINAAVVGILLSAFVRPVCTTAIRSAADVVVAAVAFVLLVRWRVAPWIIVAAVAAFSAIAAALH